MSKFISTELNSDSDSESDSEAESKFWINGKAKI